MKGSPSIFRKWQPSPVKVCLLLLVVLTTTLSAIVVRQAPNISWLDSTGRQRALSTLRGQPVIVLIAPSPRDRAFRRAAWTIAEDV